MLYDLYIVFVLYCTLLLRDHWRYRQVSILLFQSGIAIRLGMTDTAVLLCLIGGRTGHSLYVVCVA